MIFCLSPNFDCTIIALFFKTFSKFNVKLTMREQQLMKKLKKLYFFKHLFLIITNFNRGQG